MDKRKMLEELQASDVELAEAITEVRRDLEREFERNEDLYPWGPPSIYLMRTPKGHYLLMDAVVARARVLAAIADLSASIASNPT